MSHRFHRHLGLTAVILTLATAPLASTPVAVAQNAGDDQYADPFGNLPEDQGGGDPGAGAPAEPQAAPAPEGSAAAPVAPSTEASPAAGPAQQLPRTGLPAGVPAALGVALLGSGLLLVFLLGRPERVMAAVTGRPDSILHRAPPSPAGRRRGRRR
jgi:hypothetical protein